MAGQAENLHWGSPFRFHHQSELMENPAPQGKSKSDPGVLEPSGRAAPSLRFPRPPAPPEKVHMCLSRHMTDFCNQPKLGQRPNHLLRGRSIRPLAAKISGLIANSRWQNDAPFGVMSARCGACYVIHACRVSGSRHEMRRRVRQGRLWLRNGPPDPLRTGERWQCFAAGRVRKPQLCCVSGP